MRKRDVLRDIRNHIDPLLDVFVEQIGAELGIEDAAGKKNERQNEQDGDKRDEQIRDYQAVAQALEQPASPPADEAHESQERWFQTSLSVARMGVIMLSRKTILYLNRCKEGSGSIGWRKHRPDSSGPACCGVTPLPLRVADAAVVATVGEIDH